MLLREYVDERLDTHAFENRISDIFLLVDVVTRDIEARDKVRGVQKTSYAQQYYCL
jgi:hypothetical protein